MSLRFGPPLAFAFAFTEISMSMPLFIPVDLKALAVSRLDDGSEPSHAPVPGYSATSQFGGMEFLFENIPHLKNDTVGGPPLSEQANPAPFSSVAPSRELRAGVHVHWALPDSIARGRTDDKGGAPRYPEAPNRWLVVRSAAGADGRPIAQSAWVVESDRMQPNEGKPAASSGSGQGQPSHDDASPLMLDLDLFEQGVLPTLRQGRVFDLASWSEDLAAPRAKTHTAVGFGLPEFSATYAQSKNIFGFWDRADDLDAIAAAGPVTLSYCVQGWWSDLSRDPIASLPASLPDKDKQSPKAFSAALARLWSWSAPIALPADLPGRGVCHGQLSALPWSIAQGALVPQRTPSKAAVAVGNTTAEAIAAYAASRSEFAGDERFETLLHALQIGSLTSAHQSEGLSQIDETSHQAQFQSLKGGSVWAVEPLSNSKTTPGSIDTPLLTTAAGNSLAQLGAFFPAAGAALNALNAAQADLDAATRLTQALRTQVFSDWCMLMSCMHPGLVIEPPEGCDPNSSIACFNASMDSLADAAAAEKKARALRDSSFAAAQAALPKDRYALKQGSADPFWQANEPVIVLSDALLKASPRWGGDGRWRADGLLGCRLGSQTIASLAAGAASIGAADLPLVQLPPSLRFLEPQLAESLFLDPLFSGFLAHLLAAKAAGPAEAELADAIAREQRAHFQSESLLGPSPKAQALMTSRAHRLGLDADSDALLGIGADSAAARDAASSPLSWEGSWPSPTALSAWTQPFLPLFIQWRARFVADRRVQLPDPTFPSASDAPGRALADFPTAYGSSFIQDGYALSPDDTDLKRRAGAYPPDAAQSFSFSGSCTLSPNPSASLKKRIAEWGLAGDDEALALDAAPALIAQSLQGFNEQLLRRGQTLQLPIMDPLNNPPAPGLDVAKAAAAIQSQRRLAARVDISALNGIRSGYFQLEAARVIDCFGQTLDFGGPTTQVLYSNTMPLWTDPKSSAIYAELAPRVSQPARVDFKWLSASDGQQESNSLPISSPIFGWVLANHLDNALDVYSANGLPVGSFRAPSTRWKNATAAFWQPAPMLSEFQLDPNLEMFCVGLRSLDHSFEGPKYVAKILDCIERATASFTSPRLAQDDAKAILFSRPLALARASVGLELYGPPAIDQGWSAYQIQAQAIAAKKPVPRYTGGFESVQFPVEIGDSSDPDEGVVGFFAHAGVGVSKPEDFLSFHSAAATGDGDGVFASSIVPRTLCGEPQRMTVLLDPRGSLSATTGILPVKTLTVPTQHYDSALKNISVSFLASPILANAEKPACPLPSEAGSEWSLVSRAPHWSRQPMEATGARATEGRYPFSLIEGWLNLSNTTDKPKP